MVESFLKICFLSSGSILKLERVILSQNGETENVLTIQGTNWGNLSSKPWTIEHFPVSGLFFQLVSL